MKKTLRSRIAAVAVAALGAGLLSAAPADAAITAIGTLAATQDGDVIVRARAAGTISLEVPITKTAGTDRVSVMIDSVPAGAVAGDVEVGDVFSTTATGSASTATVTLGAAKTSVTQPSCTIGEVGTAFSAGSISLGTGSMEINTTSSILGTLVVGDSIIVTNEWKTTGGGSGTWATAGTVLTVTSITTNTKFTVSYSGATGQGSKNLTPDGTFKKFGSVYSAGGAVTLAANQLVNEGDTVAYSTQSLCGGVLVGTGTATSSADYFTTAGVYTMTVWYDTNNDGAVDSGETIRKAFSVTVGGTPTAVAVTPQATTIAGGGYAYGVRVSLTDAAGNATKLKSGETLTLSKTDTAVSTTLTATALTTLVTDKTYYQTSFSVNNVNGSTVLKATLGGTLNPPATSGSSAAITVIATDYAAAQPWDIEVAAGTKGVTETSLSAYEFPAAARGNDGAFVADPVTARSITYRVFGEPGKYVAVTRDNVTLSATAKDALLGADYSSLTTAHLIGADGFVDVTVAPTAVVSGNSYRFTIGGMLSYTVTYESATVNDATIKIDEIPTTGVTKWLASVGSTSSLNATVADQYNNRYAGYLVRLTTSATSRNASASIDATTDAMGKATVSWKDAGTTASTTTATTQDAVSVAVYVPNNTSTDLKTTKDSLTVWYDEKIAGSFTATGGTNNLRVWETYVGAACATCTNLRGGDADLDAGNGVLANRDASLVPVSSLLRNASLVPVTGYGVKYTAVTEGLRFITTNSNYDFYNDAVSTLWWDGTQVFAVAAKTGVNEFTVSSGGYTQTIKFTAFTHTDFARTVTLDSPAASAAPGQGLAFKATVMDGFKNVVPSTSVLFTITNGRSLSGASGATVPTGSNGVAVIEVTANAVGTVNVDVAISGGQTMLKQGFPVATFAAGSTASAKTGTIAGQSPDDKVVALAQTVSSLQTALNNLVLSVTATLTLMQGQIKKIMKKLKIK